MSYFWICSLPLSLYIAKPVKKPFFSNYLMMGCLVLNLVLSIISISFLIGLANIEIVSATYGKGDDFTHPYADHKFVSSKTCEGCSLSDTSIDKLKEIQSSNPRF